jgi:hypothetical protein
MRETLTTPKRGARRPPIGAEATASGTDSGSGFHAESVDLLIEGSGASSHPLNAEGEVIPHKGASLAAIRAFYMHAVI